MAELDDAFEALEDTSNLDAEPAEEDILGDILDMTLEDELQSHPDDLSELLEIPSTDDIAVDELANADFNELAEAVEAGEVADELPSLADIAAAAEADAVLAESAQPIVSQIVSTSATLAGVGAGAAALGAVVASKDSVDDVPRETLEITTEKQANTPKEAHMPVKAVNTDAILDEVTETAAVGAFAELNAVVEEKAVFNERGPRIGDLVQEALRPMLKDWLDENLKSIVERAVAKEVKRISSGK